MIDVSSSLTPILVIEDDDNHFDEIEAVLAELVGCTVDRQKAHDEEELYNYKSAHPDSQLVVVDLELGDRDTSGYEGLKVVDFLQKADRTAFYIIYSKHEMPVEMKEAIPAPHWAYVKKELLDDVPTRHSLECLRDVAEEFVQWCAPILVEPEYDTLYYNKELFEYSRAKKVRGKRDIEVYATGSVELSVKVLRTLVRSASRYNRAGKRTTSLAIGVFGSCGRMEMRADSDVEVTIFFEKEGASKPVRELSAIFWNRITKEIYRNDWKYEGAGLLKDNESPYLHSDQIQDGVPKQGYLPAVDVEGLVEADVRINEQYVRHRHLQILTELRAIFNARFIFLLKKAIIQTNVSGGVDSVNAVVEEGIYLPSLFTQFLLDTRQLKVRTWKDVKTVVYRTLNVLSTRLWLLGLLTAGNVDLLEEEDWEKFFDGLCAPGILKVIRFSNDSGLLKDGVEDDQEVMREKTTSLIGSYAYLLGQLSKHRVDDGSADNMITDHIRQRIRLILDQFGEVFEESKKTHSFGSVIETANWLAETTEIKALSDMIGNS